jgi:hypothetical protein
MLQSLEDTLLSVWRQTLIEHAEVVNLDGHTYPLQITKGRKLKQVDFSYGERNLRGLEQNPATKSRWAIMARQGKKVMQFLENGGYIAVVADGKIKTYSRLHKEKRP